jgi:hypothetical protein
MLVFKAARAFISINVRNISTKSIGIVGVPFDKGAGV